MSEKDILSVLLADPRETLSLLVSKSERLFRIDRQSGDLILLLPRSQLTNRQVLAARILGRYFAFKLGLVKDDELGIDELGKITGLDAKSLSARLSDLKRDGLVENSGRGTYRVDYGGLDRFALVLDEMGQTVAESGLISKDSRGDASSSYLGIEFQSVSDADAVLLALYANHAFLGSDVRMSADDIFDWLSGQGSFVKRETLKKYTLPQHAVLKALLNKTLVGKQLQYQLSRPGMERAGELVSKLGRGHP